MALLNASDYNELAGVSSISQRRQPGKFFSAFITGASREGQEIGKFQVMTDIDEGKYLLQNRESILFIPYYIKRIWSKYAASENQSGQSYNKLVAFGWNDDVPKIDDDCRYSYIIAGLLLDEKGQAMKHDEDIDDADISKGDPALVHFHCYGMKFNGAMKFIDHIAEKAKDLPPLSNNPEFERTVVWPRRFICKASKATAPSKHGDKAVFEFTVAKQLPDKVVAQVMDSAKDLLSEFEKQFDKTASIRSDTSNLSPNSDTPVFNEAPGPVPESDVLGDDDDFSLGI